MEKMPLKGEWKFVVVVHGALSVMISGVQLMLKWCVTNLDLTEQVCISLTHALPNNYAFL